MKINDFLENAWRDHGKHAQDVADRIISGIKLIEGQDHVPQMAQLIVHVYGEHLGQWDEGVKVLNQLRKSIQIEDVSEADKAIARSIATLELASGKQSSISHLPMSEQIRSMAVAASALCGQSDTKRAHIFFEKALELAQVGINSDDPANRALAVTGNNLASSLEEKESRTHAENELMIFSALVARKFWEIAGGWTQVERAEYRLSKSYLSAGNVAKALEHAQNCIEISQNNNAPALEYFFGYEALAVAEKSQRNKIGFSNAKEQMTSYFNKLNENDKNWCQSILQKLDY